MVEVPDDELVRRARGGDRRAYGEIVERYQAAILRRALAILRDPEAAPDAAQEALVRAYSYLDSYDTRYRLYTWLARIVTNVCLSQLSGRQWHTLPLDRALLVPTQSLEEDDPVLATLAHEREQVLHEAVSGLPAKYRDILVLRYWNDLAYEEIARRTKQSLGAVKTQLHRARLLLADNLRGRPPHYEWETEP